jgi:hypothetical protein
MTQDTAPQTSAEDPPDTTSDITPDEPAHLPPAARRALAEAEARRRAAKALDLPTELGGRDGPEPVRYGDWEKKGIAIDF